MESETTTPNMAYAVLGAVLEDPVPVAIRAGLWIFVAIWFPVWLAVTLLIGVIMVPYLRYAIDGPGEMVGWGIDAVLFVLAWRAMDQIFGNWFIASVLLGAVLFSMNRFGMLFSRTGSGAKLVIFREPEISVEPIAFVQGTLASALAILEQHGWTQGRIRQNNVELKRYKYKAQLIPKGQLEIVCFDESFEGDVTYPMPLLGEVTLTLDLPGASAAAVRAIYDDISAAVHKDIPETSGTVM